MSAVKRQLEDEKDSNKFRTEVERDAWVRFAAGFAAKPTTDHEGAAGYADRLLALFRERGTP